MHPDNVPPTHRPQAGSRLQCVPDGTQLVVAGELDMCTAAELRAVLAGTPMPPSGHRLDLTGLTYIDGHGARVLFDIARCGLTVRLTPDSPVALALQAAGLAEVATIEPPSYDQPTRRATPPTTRPGRTHIAAVPGGPPGTDTRRAPASGPAMPERLHLATTDPATTEAFLARHHGCRLQPGNTLAQPGGLSVQIERLDAGQFSSTHARLRGALRFQIEPRDVLTVAVLEAGTVRFEQKGQVELFGPGDVFIAGHPQLVQATCRTRDVQLEALTLRLRPAAGKDDPIGALHRLRFSARAPLGPRAAQSWRQIARYAHELLVDPEAAGPRVIEAAARLLAATAMVTFPHLTLAETRGERGDALPGPLRRAVAFIEANADRETTVGEIAAAAGVTVRTVQLAFRRHLDCTPTEHARRVRLQAAHGELLAADPSRTTVSAVAHRWGFSNSGRFAATYRATYGCPPNQTLHS